MTIKIDDAELDTEIVRLSAATGETADELVARTLRERLMSRREQPSPMSALDADEMIRKIRKIQAEVATLPVLDTRTPDEIMGFNEHGHFA